MNQLVPNRQEQENTYLLPGLVLGQSIIVRIKKIQVKGQSPSYEISIQGLLGSEIRVGSEHQELLRSILSFFDNPSF